MRPWADDIIAQSKHLKVGDHIYSAEPWVYHQWNRGPHGKGARFFVPLQTAQEIPCRNRVSMFYVRSKGDTEKARAEILGLNPKKGEIDFRVRELMSSSNLPELRPVIRSMVGLGMSSAPRGAAHMHHGEGTQREVGILKGARISRFDIVRMLLGESWCYFAGSALRNRIGRFCPGNLKETTPGLNDSHFRALGIFSHPARRGRAALGGCLPAFRAASMTRCSAGL